MATPKPARSPGTAANGSTAKSSTAKSSTAKSSTAKSSPAKGSTAKSSPASGPGARAAADKKKNNTRGGRPDPLPSAAGAGGQPGKARPAPARARATAATPRDAEPTPAPAATLRAPRWLQITTLVLSLGGLGDSIYLTIAHYTSTSILACSDKGTINCALVTTSPESIVFGIFPVAVLGLAFYVFMVAVNTPWAWQAKLPAIRWARLGSVIVGIGFVLYLVYTEVITLDHICLYCTYVHVITLLLFGLIVFSASAGYGVKPAADRQVKSRR
jgi:uncharacterized membrane protein